MKNYKEYMEHQIPSPELVDKTYKRMMEEEKKKPASFPIYRYASAAAAFLCVIGGAWYLNRPVSYDYNIVEQQVIRSVMEEVSGENADTKSVELSVCNEMTGKSLENLPGGYEAQSAEQTVLKDGTGYYIIYYKGNEIGLQLKFSGYRLSSLSEEYRKGEAHTISGNAVWFSKSEDGKQLYASWTESNHGETDYLLQAYGMENSEFEKLIKKILS